jgi:hypothetical protein
MVITPQPSTTKVKLAKSNKNSMSIEDEEKLRDVQSLLEENIVLLRDAYKHVSSENAALREVNSLKEELVKFRSHHVYDTKKIIFQIIVVLNIILSVCFCISGPLLWYFRLVPIEFWCTILGGIIWSGITMLVSQEPWK